MPTMIFIIIKLSENNNIYKDPDEDKYSLNLLYS